MFRGWLRAVVSRWPHPTIAGAVALLVGWALGWDRWPAYLLAFALVYALIWFAERMAAFHLRRYRVKTDRLQVESRQQAEPGAAADRRGT